MERRLLLVASVLLVYSLLLGACAPQPEPLVSQTREVAGFDRVVLEGIGDLRITQGEAEALTIEAAPSVVDDIQAQVRDGTLRISFHEAWPSWLQGGPGRPIRYHLTVKELSGLALEGAGSITASGIQADRLELDLAGAGSVAIEDLSAEDFQARLDGLGSCAVAGQAASQDVQLNGAGSYDAGGLKSEEATVRVAGAGSATVWAVDRLEAEIAGLGSIGYYGDPQVDSTVSAWAR